MTGMPEANSETPGQAEREALETRIWHAQKQARYCEAPETCPDCKGHRADAMTAADAYAAAQQPQPAPELPPPPASAQILRASGPLHRPQPAPELAAMAQENIRLAAENRMLRELLNEARIAEAAPGSTWNEAGQLLIAAPADVTEEQAAEVRKALDAVNVSRAAVAPELAAARAALALIDPAGLELLADWFDADDSRRGGGRATEVQDDLRKWAKAVREARAGLPS